MASHREPVYQPPHPLGFVKIRNTANGDEGEIHPDSLGHYEDRGWELVEDEPAPEPAPPKKARNTRKGTLNG